MIENCPTLSSLFTPRQIVCHLQEVTCQEATHRLLELIDTRDAPFDVLSTHQLIVQRQHCGATLILPEVAVIHARLKAVKEFRVALGTSPGGLKCAGIGGQFACPVMELTAIRLVVLMLAPADDATGYLRASTALANVCRREGFLSRLLSFEDSAQAWRWFEATAERLPEYVTAGDIMDSGYPRLRNVDTLSDAIDAFCSCGVSEMPVVDEEGDLVGVVNEDELIKIGLPEYVTWMEDLSPILNFEPFVEILRREARVPVFQIMAFADRYATIDETSPAIQVAKVMLRRDVRQVYVMRGKKFAGVISIQDFVQKVLRA